MLSTTASYLAIVNNQAAQQAAVAREPDVKAATSYYLANIGKVTSITAFVNNTRLLNYALKAYGLEDQTNAKGLITKVLQGGVGSAKSLANTLSDQRWRAFAAAYDFAGKGAAATTAASATTGATALYGEQTLEDQAGTANPGVQLALYFTQHAPGLTSLYGLLADKNLLKVVQTAFGLPTSASTNIDAEEQTLAKHVSLADLKDPAKVKAIAERFAAQYDASGANTGSGTSTIAQIFAASSSTAGVSSDLLLSLQGLKLGGA